MHELTDAHEWVSCYMAVKTEKEKETVGPALPSSLQRPSLGHHRDLSVMVQMLYCCATLERIEPFLFRSPYPPAPKCLVHLNKTLSLHFTSLQKIHLAASALGCSIKACSKNSRIFWHLTSGSVGFPACVPLRTPWNRPHRKSSSITSTLLSLPLKSSLTPCPPLS